MGMLAKEIDIATKAHEGQVDKGGNPYILHPLRVMAKQQYVEAQIVAVLHDVLEDTAVTDEDLLSMGFGETIVDAVISMTKKKHESYREFILRCKQNPIARIVKIADIEDNCNISRIDNPTEKDYRRLEKYQKALRLLI